MLGRVNEVFARRHVNIAGQYLQTSGELGYVVVETELEANSWGCLQELKALEGTIRARVIWRV